MKIQRPKLNYEMEWTELQWSGENVQDKVALKIEEVLKRIERGKSKCYKCWSAGRI